MKVLFDSDVLDHRLDLDFAGLEDAIAYEAARPGMSAGAAVSG
jgi:hypothetical protein